MNSNNIKNLRLKNGFASIGSLAKKMELKPGILMRADTLGRIERGDRGLSRFVAQQIAKICNCNVDEVYDSVTAVNAPIRKTDNPLPIVGIMELGVGIILEKTGAVIPRPSIVDGINDAYAFVTPDNEMNPAFREGEKLVIDPTATPVTNDYVICTKKINDKPIAVVREIIKIDNQKKKITLKQYNPSKNSILSIKDILSLDVVVMSYKRK
jgi:hypothetical protein